LLTTFWEGEAPSEPFPGYGSPGGSPAHIARLALPEFCRCPTAQ
jgi:hypothetical protein